jgi:hypothetical protein
MNRPCKLARHFADYWFITSVHLPRGTDPMGERATMRRNWWRLGIALFMGSLVGQYGGFITASLLEVVISCIALALPLVLSVALDHTLTPKSAALIWVTAPVLVLSSLLIAGTAFPAVWQGYSGDAAFLSLGALILLAPLAAAFAVGVHGGQLAKTGTLAVACAAVAWLGIGIHNVVIPYLFPLLSIYYASVIQHATMRAGFGGGILLGTIIILYISLIYLAGFGLATIEGLLGGALRSRLARSRAPRTPVSA